MNISEKLIEIETDLNYFHANLSKSTLHINDYQSLSNELIKIKDKLRAISTK